MALRREFFMLFATAGCAVALISSATMSGPQAFDLSAPLRFEVLSRAEPMLEDDNATLALRQQARAALAGLQTAAVATQ